MLVATPSITGSVLLILDGGLPVLLLLDDELLDIVHPSPDTMLCSSRCLLFTDPRDVPCDPLQDHG